MGGRNNVAHRELDKENFIALRAEASGVQSTNADDSSMDSGTLMEQMFKDKEGRRKIDHYIDTIIEYNNKINIIGRLNRTQIIYNLINPSIMSTLLIDKSSRHIMDIGAGSGILGITVKLIIKNVDLLLLEKNSKKIAFLHEIITQLDIKNVNIIHNSLENVPKNSVQHVDQLLIRGIKLVKILKTIHDKFPRGTKILYFGSEKDVDAPSISIQRRLDMPGNESRKHSLYIYSLTLG